MSTRREFLMQASAASAVAAANAPLAQAAAPSPSVGAGKSIQTYKIARTDLAVSRIAYGCGTLVNDRADPHAADVVAHAEARIKTAYDNGVTLFDLAAMYAGGKAESGFGAVLKRSSGLRHKVVIQTKCGALDRIKAYPGDAPFSFDCSREHIVSSAEASLRRLGTDRIDILLLHWPDLLLRPEEVAQAFDELHRSGKVRYFGLSNHTVGQIELLKKYVRQPLIINQLQLGLGHSSMIAAGLQQLAGWEVQLPQGHPSLAGILDYCRLQEMQLQAYSPLLGVTRAQLANPPADASPEVKEAARVLREIAAEKNTAPLTVALAWLLHHPAGIVAIIGARDPEHIIENCAAEGIRLTREEWFKLFFAVARVQAT